MGEGQLISDAANEARPSLGAGKWGGRSLGCPAPNRVSMVMVTAPGPKLHMGEGQLISDAANEARGR